MEILEILQRESENTQQAYLYEKQGHWCAYENSAYLVNLLLSGNAKTTSVVNSTYEICLEMIEVEFSSLINCAIILCSDSELVIDCSTTLH